MLSTETIIIIAIVIVALSALGYYCYTKITSHERYINTIHQRCQQLEIILTQPSPPMEIDTVFNTPSSFKKEETRTTTICDEENGMCYLKPIHEEDEERGGGGDEDESLVQEEIDRLLSSSVKETTSHSKKKKPSLPAPPTSTIEEE